VGQQHTAGRLSVGESPHPGQRGGALDDQRIPGGVGIRKLDRPLQQLSGDGGRSRGGLACRRGQPGDGDGVALVAPRARWAATRSTRASLDARPAPHWYADAKLGIFVHWGLYSIPAFAERTGDDYTAFMRDLTAGKDTGGRIPYAEWYLNALRVPGSATSRYHRATYGKDFSYFDFRGQFDSNAATVDFADWAACFAGAGARYVVMVTRHLDGYPLWPTSVANPHMPPEYRSTRDLVGDLTRAVRAQGLRMGLYYAGGLDWTFVSTPIRTMADFMRQQALGPEYARYAAAQWTELIDAYQPAILWNDVGWPAESDPHELFAHYYDAVADGVVNDRWTKVSMPGSHLVRGLYLRFISLALKSLARVGRPLPRQAPSFHHDFQTHEYAAPDPAPTRPWELTRGLGRSFGYNAQETVADTLTGTQLVHLLIDVVAHGGNLLINVGPDGAGRIPEIQRQPLRELGAWLDVNGEAIYETRPWTRPAGITATGQQVRYTRKDHVIYAIVLSDRLADSLTIGDLTLPVGSRIRMLNGSVDLPWTQDANGVRIETPERPANPHAQVLEIRISSGEVRYSPRLSVPAARRAGRAGRPAVRGRRGVAAAWCRWGALLAGAGGRVVPGRGGAGCVGAARGDPAVRPKSPVWCWLVDRHPD